MKILERGQIPPEPTRQIRCAKCVTLFEFTESETRTVHRYGRSVDEFIDCPVCKQTIGLQPGGFDPWMTLS